MVYWRIEWVEKNVSLHIDGSHFFDLTKRGGPLGNPQNNGGLQYSLEDHLQMVDFPLSHLITVG